ncbi:DEAD/DEAH box helicase [Alcanivorax profundi]|uniref:DEAD/DEAH box helicase n=3 Tax=Alcanivorax profundi TaxID=2338368 RepID=A0A418XYZ2_9GAMM|nr:DEAD/DEAH box helicase [Alcanivorax profundi]RJG18254.1 DEAD/DEAH box helicase [Alcanivorax profundi]
MGFRESIAKMLGKNAGGEEAGLSLLIEEEGISFYASPGDLATIKSDNAGGVASTQHVALTMLCESGQAQPISNGFFLPSESVACLDDDILSILQLPPRAPLQFQIKVEGKSTHPAFKVSAFVLIDGESYPINRKGPILSNTSRDKYTLTAPQLLALDAIDIHAVMSPDDRGEGSNLRLIATLQQAKRDGLDINLSHFDNINVAEAERIGLTVSKLPDGSIELSPTLGDGTPYSDLLTRWAQLDPEADEGAMRIGNRIVLLDKQKMEGIREVFASRRIPADQVARFMETPTAFIDAALVDLDTGFSVRVDGVGTMRHIAIGELDAKGADWFTQEGQPSPPQVLSGLIQSEEDADRIEQEIAAAHRDGASTVVIDGQEIDISDENAVTAVIEKARKGLTEPDSAPEEDAQPDENEKRQKVSVLIKDADEQREELLALAADACPSQEPDWSLYQRTPFPHQKAGIDWLVGLGEQAQHADAEQLYRMQGCLLADDMGLGKTFMALVSLSELMRRQRSAGKAVKPVLVVAPLSLLENWEEEVEKTFKRSPFRDIVVLQGGRDLKRFRIPNTERETVQIANMADGEIDMASLRYALHVGPEAGPDRLDMDARLVLTTYQTLRDYQFSLCRIDWGTVIFDEAQNIKNPNTGVTCAAKALKSSFKVLATGTPVENSLLDFWCVMDTAQPGLLGDWPAFREEYVKPILKAEDEDRNQVRQDVGKKLRQAVGRFMLRRTKEEELTGLPKKSIFGGAIHEPAGGVEPMPALARTMRGAQLQAYNQVLDNYQSRRHEEVQGLAISSLHQLRSISLHPRLQEGDITALTTARDVRSVMAESAKLEALLQTLDDIRARKEKVIIFLITKKLQMLLKLWLDRLYGLDVGIINGDTKAVSTKADDATRKGMIREFEARAGFNILIMSPVAAGVGLTVVGANNVIHLERHWNPAKEAQASDRVYRIGQEKAVNIYLPAAHHPERDAFDVHLHRLLDGKLLLKDAVVTTEAVSEAEMLKGMGLG